MLRQESRKRSGSPFLVSKVSSGRMLGKFLIMLGKWSLGAVVAPQPRSPCSQSPEIQSNFLDFPVCKEGHRGRLSRGGGRM